MHIERREFLRLAVIGCGCGLSAGLMPAQAADHAAPHWSYGGDSGPEHWAELSSHFKTCGLGPRQTPIDLAHARRDGAASFGFDYRPSRFVIVNNGHTVQVSTEPDSAIVIDGEKFELQQFHFHHPSEHLLDGKAFDMEVHFVHRSAAGSLAVVGVFIETGAHNAGLQPIFDRMPKSKGGEIEAVGRFDPAAFFPARRSFYRYMGSLTTPPCSEGLTWTIFHDPIQASAEQIAQFAALFPNNARPIQKRNNRLLIESSGP
jgi:carbonic anhydrase